MKRIRIRVALKRIPLLAVTLAACTQISQEVHARTTGMKLRSGGTDVVVITGSGSTGGISLQPGAQSDALTVHFIGASGEVMIPRGGYYLEVVSSNPAVATWAPAGSGAFAGRVAALLAGETRLEFRFMHGPVGSGHPDARYSVGVVVSPSPQ